MKIIKHLFFISFSVCCLALCHSYKSVLTELLDAGILANEYADDPATADRKYKDKYLTITGFVAQSYTNMRRENIIVLLDKKKINGVKCFLGTSAKKPDKPFKSGEIITINGKCAGFDDYVILKNCIILRN